MQNSEQWGFPVSDLKNTQLPQPVIDILEIVSKKYQGHDLLVALLSLTNDNVKVLK